MFGLSHAITRCADILRLTQMDHARHYMAETMALLFNAQCVSLFGRDTTNEHYIELASTFSRETYFETPIDKSEHNADILSWAFGQKNAQSINLTENSIYLNQLIEKFFFPSNIRQAFIIPGIVKPDKYADLIFIISLPVCNCSTETIETAQSLAEFFATFNRLNVNRNKIEYHEEVLEKSIAALSSTVKKQDEIAEDQLRNILIGTSADIIKIRREIRLFGPMTTAVLIQGNTGTGKELVAQALHRFSNRKREPFVAVNMASLNSNLLESEFFGYVKGAFTGADKRREGYLSAAKSGTLFLDEIGDLTPPLQAKLLRVLQEKMFVPVGSTKECHFRARIISATHKNLAKMANEGTFRKDLYYRIAESQIRISNLSDRPTDITPLSIAFVDNYNQAVGANYKLSHECLKTLMELDYPGNVRQLKSLIINICEVSRTAGSITPEIIKTVYSSNVLEKTLDKQNPFSLMRTKGLIEACNAFEKDALIKFSHEFHGSRSAMAHALKISERSLYNKFKKYGLEGSGDEALV